MILAEKVLMIEPRGFTFNEETSVDNLFQTTGQIKLPAEAAMKEFHDMKYKLMKAGLTVIVISPVDDLQTPDAVFPNNWFSTTPDGRLILYPMMAANRRLERRKEIIEKLKKDYKKVTDMSPMEETGKFLEGTGSLVIDHENKKAYASLSLRTNADALKEWAKVTGYEIITFTSHDLNKEVIYHTNVVLTIMEKFNIICLDAIDNDKDREKLRADLSKNKELIVISKEQMHAFCGNCLGLKNNSGEKFLVMSTQAFQAFTNEQKNVMIRHTTIIHSGLPTIETIGGGSARCMMAELF